MNIQFPQWFFSKEPGRGTSASANLRRFGSVCSRGRAARHTTMASAMNVPLGADDAWWKSKDWCLCHDLQKAFGARMYTTFWTWDNLILVWTLNWDYWYVLLMFLHQRTKGSLFRKFPSYGRMSRGSLIIIIIIIIILILIIIIMSSSCQQHKKQEGRRSRMSVSAQVDVGKLSTKSVPNCGESRMCTSKCWKTEQPVLHGRVRTVDAARNLVDLLRCSCYAGLQAAVTNRIDTAARSKVWVMLRQSCYSSLQLEVAHSFMHSFHFISFHSISFHSFTAFILGLIHSFLHSFLHSSMHLLIHPFMHACMHSFIYWFIPSFNPSFLPSCIPSFMHSFIRSFLHSRVHSAMHFFIDLFLHSFIHSFRHVPSHWFVPSFIHSVLHAVIDSFLHSLIHSCIHSIHHSFLHSFIPSFLPCNFISFHLSSVASLISFLTSL